MGTHILAVCDVEKEYAYGFSQYLSGKKAMNFQVQTFTSVEQLCLFQEQHEKTPIEILLIGENTYSDRVLTVKAGHILLLSEEETSSQKEFPFIFKYQSMEKIVQKIREEFHDFLSLAVEPDKRKAKLIGIYTPIGRCLQTSLALLLGQLLGKKKKVLYLNLEPFSGFSGFMNREYHTDIIDMMYVMNQMKENFAAKFHSMLETCNEMDYIPPAFSFLDLSSITEENWTAFLDYLFREEDYAYILLDLSDNVQGLFSLLKRCDTVYTLIKEDGISMAKVAQYETLLKTMDYGDVLEKTKQFQFPVFRNLPFEVEELPFCEMAKYVKAIIKEDLHEELSGA